MPVELPSIEDALKDMVGAMNALKKHGLDKVEILRLTKIISSCKAYNKEFAAYLNYRELEERLIELEAKYAELVKRKETPSISPS